MNSLSTVPEAENKNNIPLSAGERVLFASKTDAFCTETQETLKWDCKFTLTDRRIVVDGGDEIWTINIPNDIERFRIEEKGHGFMKITYTVIKLKKQIECLEGKVTLNGCVIYFKKRDIAKLKEITDRMFVSERIYEDDD